jgi:hypothetical protein
LVELFVMEAFGEPLHHRDLPNSHATPGPHPEEASRELRKALDERYRR